MSGKIIPFRNRLTERTNERRRWYRVPLVGTSAYAAVELRTIPILDFGYGGVALEIPIDLYFQPIIMARIFVPILGSVTVRLQQRYERPNAEKGTRRVGYSYA
ncbi:MAG TPA: hypothetical protein VND65_18035 [Candidatus Binatia bacterium]|nr:hypothetical protein [Candidatus Binatia bacterium]